MPRYRVTLNGQNVEVSSEKDLSDFEVYQAAKQNLSQSPEKPPPSEDSVREALARLSAERYGRPVSDTGEPYSDLGTRVADMGASMAHPTSLSDIGHLIFAGTDMTRLGPGMAAGANAARGPASSALIKTGGVIDRTGSALQPHAAQSAIMDAILRGRPLEAIGVGVAPTAIQALGRLTQRAGRFIAPATKVAGEAAPATMAASPAAAEALQQSSSFRNLPSEAQVWSDAPATAGRTAAPLAQAAQKVTALASQMKIALDPTEVEAVSRLVMEGYDPAAILEQVARQKLPSAFQGLPTNATVEATKRFPKGMRGKAPTLEAP